MCISIAASSEGVHGLLSFICDKGSQTVLIKCQDKQGILVSDY